MTGSNTDIATLYASAGLSNLGDENITITNDLTVAEANAIDLLTTGVVSASIASTVDVGTLGDLTGTNSYTYVLPGGTPLTVSGLNGIIDSISIDVDASGVTSLTGDFNDVVGIYNSSKVNGLEDKDINITSDLTVDEANSLDLLTSGIVSGSIITTERVAELVTLTGLNAYSIIIPSVDALSTTAADLNTINAATSVAVNLTNVTALAESSFSDLETLGASIANSEFSNVTGLTTVALSDTTIDATALAILIDSIDTINGGSTTNMTLAYGATINVDAAEVASLLADEAAGRLTINNQSIIVNGEIPAIFAVSLSDTTSGLVTATIEEKSLVDLAVLPLAITHLQFQSRIQQLM